MAPVTAGGGDDRGPDGDRGDRAQLMVVGALTIAVTLVALALVLNSGIFTHNLSSRADTSANDAVGVESSVRSSVGGLVDEAVETNLSAGTAAQETAIVNGIDEIESELVGYETSKGTYFTLSYLSKTDGRYLGDDQGNFTDTPTGPGNEDWVLLSSPARFRSYNFTINRSSLSDPGLADPELASITDLTGSDSFYAQFESGGGDVYKVYLYQDGTDTVYLKVEDPSGSLSSACSANESAAGTVSLDVTGATLNRTRCAPLEFLEPGTEYELAYENGNNASGTYSLYVRDSGDVSGAFSNSVSDPPYDVPAVYSVRVELLYQTADLTYRADLTVEEGRPDD